jgi:hypothetical protein
MAWIELHTTLRNNPKTFLLMNMLKIKRPPAIGTVSLFWTWALDAAPDGDISKFPAHAIAEACCWEKSPDVLLNALIECGWIDKDSDGRLLIHDWDEYTWRYFDKVEQAREQTKKRVAEYRKRKKTLHCNGDVTKSNGDVTVPALHVTQCNAPTIPNLTIPNEREITTTTTPARDPIVDNVDNVDNLPTIEQMREALDQFQTEGAEGKSRDALIKLSLYELIIEYSKYFDDAENAAEVVSALVTDFGYDLAYECIHDVGARASPKRPAVPAAYIREMCRNRLGG